MSPTGWRFSKPLKLLRADSRWITEAKRPETRARRLEQAVRRLEANRKRAADVTREEKRRSK